MDTPATDAPHDADAMEASSAFKNDITFDVKFRGYDKTQVEDYLAALTVDYNDICAQCDVLEHENAGLRALLSRVGRSYQSGGASS